jgi:zinc transport system ATP-binding protein
MATPLIAFENVSFQYGISHVLDGINLQIFQNDFLAIIGPNGGGKSTLLRLIVKAIKPQKGTIFIDPKQTIGYVPQNTNININFPITALDVVLTGLVHNRRVFGYSKEEKKQAIKALEKVDMHDCYYKRIDAFSGGQRQRIFIARALIANPTILLLDEPTASIDSIGQGKIYDLLQELNKEMTIIVISHDLSIILQYAKRAAYLNQHLTMHENIKSFDIHGDHFCEVELLNTLSEHVHEHKCQVL